MSDEKQPEKKDVELKVFSRDTLERQVKESEALIVQLRKRVTDIQADIEQNIGVLNYAQFLLAKFALPPKPEEPKKTLEVK